MSKIPQVREYEGWPVVTAQKMKYLDRKAVMDFRMEESVLMENAGKGIAGAIISDTEAKKILVCCGRGNNGGDGLVAARCLKEAGRDAEVVIAAPGRNGYGKLVVENLNRAREKGVPVMLADPENIDGLKPLFGKADAFLDALLGVGAVGKPTGIIKKIIQMMNRTGKAVYAADIPSGLSPDTGHHSGVFVKAHMTLTLGFPKTGLMAPHAQKNIGRIKVIDIGYPKEIIEEAGS